VYFSFSQKLSFRCCNFSSCLVTSKSTKFYSLRVCRYHPSNSCQHAERTGQRGKNRIGKRNSSSVTAIVAALRSTLTRTHRRCIHRRIHDYVFECLPKVDLFRQQYYLRPYRYRGVKTLILAPNYNGVYEKMSRSDSSIVIRNTRKCKNRIVICNH